MCSRRSGHVAVVQSSFVADRLASSSSSLILTLPVPRRDELLLRSQCADGSGEDDVGDKSMTQTLWKCVASLTVRCRDVCQGHGRRSTVGSWMYRSESSSPGWTTLPDWTSIQPREPQSCKHSVAVRTYR